jgi:tetratricopeptide (TPR) repeat protein
VVSITPPLFAQGGDVSTSAESLNELGNDLASEGRVAEAEQAYRAATAADPTWSAPWYNLGLLYKNTGRWTDSARCNERAVELDPDDGDAWWNLGIAATATADWARARRAWQMCGIDLPDLDEEPRRSFGPVPIRLNPDADGEVVWCDRIDPARAIIRNIPLPRSGYREGDVLLHDGAPNGYRKIGDREYAVFDALQVLIPSERNTFEAMVEAADESCIAALEQRARAAGIAFEDWETMTWLCKQCSEGTPHVEHDYNPGPWHVERRIALSAHSEDEVTQLLGDWAAAVVGARVLSVRCASPADGR